MWQSPYLLQGEVVRIVYPDDPASRSRRYTEYDVLAQDWGNDTATTVLFEGVPLANGLAGFADRSRFTLRAADSTAADPAAAAQATGGSQVLLLRVGGHQAGAVIVGGLRDERDDDVDARDRGHFWEARYNGVTASVEDDGGWRVVFRGPTGSDGQPLADTAGTGTTVAVAANGDFDVRSGDGKTYVHGDVGASTLTTQADRVEHGAGADQPHLLGDEVGEWLSDLCDALAALTVVAGTGPTSVPVNTPAFQALRARVPSLKSLQSFVKRSA